MANSGNVKNRIQDVGSKAVDKAKDATSYAAQTAGEYATTAKDKADDAVSAVGDSAKSLAETIRDKGPQEGFLGSATSKVADSIESGGRYLQEEGLSGMVDDLGTLIKRNPVPAFFIGLGIGCLLGMATQRMSHG